MAFACVVSCKHANDTPANHLECSSDLHPFTGGQTRGFVLPNGFSPNGDGRNDLLRMVTNDTNAIKSAQLRISDSTGTLVYTITQWRQSWDGYNYTTKKFYPGGTYRVDYDIVFNDGTTTANAVYNGHTCVFLFRPNPSMPSCLFIQDPSILNYIKFEDQLDPVTLFTPYTTGENFCP